jgi:hypothetical protein
MHTFDPGVPFATCVRLVLASLVATTVGCGAAYYEARLNETAQQFAYYHKLNENLGIKWAAAGIELRAPKQFTPDLGARAVTDVEGAVQEELFPRQPDYFPEGVELPGLVGAWKAIVDAPAPAGESAEAYLYVMTNREMFLNDETLPAAPEFHARVLGTLCEGVQMDPPQPDDPRWASESFPAGPGYVPRKQLTTITLVPGEPVGDLVREFRLYLHAAGDIQTAYLYVIPTGISSRENLPERIGLAFETLNVDATIPRRTPEGEAGAGPGAIQF